MITDLQKGELVAEFSELGDEDATLQKEVYAHFGLLFFKFSLVEHSLINIVTFHHVGNEQSQGKIQCKFQWEKVYDSGYKIAKKMTFGNLVRAVGRLDEFNSLKTKLSEIKECRDYFAHHFFREEIGLCLSDEGCWHLLWEIQQLRIDLIQLDDQLRIPTEQMCKRLAVPILTEEMLWQIDREMRAEVNVSLAAGNPEFGWKKHNKQ